MTERKILFRGKRADNGEWVYGDFPSPCNIVFEEGKVDDRDDSQYMDIVDYSIISETLGQFTGLYDSHGKKIFEGDIISIFGLRHEVRYLVDKSAFYGICHETNSKSYLHNIVKSICKVIGNVHDLSPEEQEG